MLGDVLAGTEETTTGVIRLRAMESDGALEFPVIAVNDAKTKHFFDNRYGTGQSTIDGVIRATNILLAGRRSSCAATAGAAGAGRCGRAGMGRTSSSPRSIRWRARGRHGRLPGRADRRGGRLGDIFVTVTGNKHVIRGEHFEVMKDGADLANTGHFDVELDIPALRDLAARSTRGPRVRRASSSMADGRGLYVLGEGRLVNLAAAEGHPASVMDMSFAEPGAGGRVCRPEPARASSTGSTPCRRRSTTRSRGSSSRAWRRHRRADRRAAPLHGHLGRGHLSPRSPLCLSPPTS